MGIFRTGHGLSKAGQAEAVVDALIQNAAQPRLAFQNQNVPDAAFMESRSGSKAGRTAADDNYLSFHRVHPFLTSPVNRYAPSRL